MYHRYIEARLKSNWTTTPVVFENQEYTPVSGTSFVYARIIDVDESQLSIGEENQRFFRVLGFISIAIMVPYGHGLGTARGYADTIAAIFRGAQFSGILCRAPRVEVVGREAEWYQVQVIVPFQKDSAF